MKISKKKILGAGAAAVILAGGAGVAFAYWTTSGSGIGQATTTAGNDSAVSVVSDTVTGLYPGQGAQPVTVHVTNTDTSQTVYVKSISAYLTIDSDHATAGCSAADYTLNGTAGADASNAQAVTWTPKELTAGQRVDTSASIQFNDLTTTQQDYCKGATVTINYTSN